MAWFWVVGRERGYLVSEISVMGSEMVEEAAACAVDTYM